MRIIALLLLIQTAFADTLPPGAVKINGGSDGTRIGNVGDAFKVNVTNAIPVTFPSPLPSQHVTVDNFPFPVPTQAVLEVNPISGFSLDSTLQSVLAKLGQIFGVQTDGTQKTQVTNFPEIQTVNGTVSISNVPTVSISPSPLPVIITGPSPLPVSGSVSISNFPSSQNVVVTNTPTVTGPLTDTQLRASAVPISALSLPLPSGASTSALQTTGNTTLSTISTTLSSIKADVDKIPTSPATDRITAAAPFAFRLSDGASFYQGFKSGDSIGNTAFTANAGTNLNTSALNLETTQSVFKTANHSDLSTINTTLGTPIQQTGGTVGSKPITTTVSGTGTNNDDVLFSVDASGYVAGYVQVNTVSAVDSTTLQVALETSVNNTDWNVVHFMNTSGSTPFRFLSLDSLNPDPDQKYAKISGFARYLRAIVWLNDGSGAVSATMFLTSYDSNDVSGRANSAVLMDGDGSFLRGQKVKGLSLPVTLPADQDTVSSQGASSVGKLGNLVLGVATINANPFLNNTIAPLSLNAGGALRVDGSLVTQPVSGTLTVQQAVAGNLKVDLSSTSANSIAIKVDGSAVTQPENISQVAGATAQSGSGTSPGALRVELPNNGTGVVGLNSGSNIIGKVGIDQTTNGTTNRVNIGSDGTVAGTGNFTVVQSTASNLNANVSGTVTAAQATAASLNATVVTTGGVAVAKDSSLSTINTTLGTPAQEHNTAASPNSCRLSDGAAFYTGFKSGDSIGNTAFTANIGTSGSLALDTSVTGLQVSQGSTTTSQKGSLIQGAVTTSAPSYTTAQTSPLSLTTAGALRVDASATNQTVTANIGTSGSLALNSTLTGGTAQTKITNGTNVADVTAGSAASVATDKSFSVSLNPSGGNPCMNPSATLTSINGATSTNNATQIIALSGTTKIYICSMNITGVSGTTPTFSLVQGTGTNCANSQVTLLGAWTTAANTIYNFTGPTVAVGVAGDAICYKDGGTSPVQNYNIVYVQQ